MFTPDEINSKAELYAQHRQIALLGMLGSGKDGSVWQTSQVTALKIHMTRASYLIERNAYIRLLDLDVENIAGFSVPTLRDFDD